MKDKSDLKCDVYLIHPEVINKVRKTLPTEDEIIDVSDFFKVYGDPTRLKIICALFSSEMCVCDLSQLLNMSDSAISHQLRVLKQSRFVKSRRDGRNIYYSIMDDHIKEIANIAAVHLSEKK